MESERMNDDDGDIALLLEALQLEREAVRRYVAHAGATSDPRLVSHWESLRRNEAEHRGLLQAALRARDVEPPGESDHAGGEA
jgi:rubrerythrin